MRKAVNTGVRSWPNQRKAMRITDMTGVAAMTEKRGLNRECTRRFRPDPIPAAIPRGAAISTPRMTRIKVFPRETRKRRVGARRNNFFTTKRGPGRSRAPPTYRAAASQAPRNKTVPRKNQGKAAREPAALFLT
jgi:hypothetical protein